MSTGKSH
jgi:hypothetical protein